MRPDYGGAWIGGLLPALSAGRAPAGAPAWVAEAEPIVLVLVDGLGWTLWRRFAEYLPGLADAEAAVLTSVVPSTTASALPSVTTGRPPGDHGLLGDRVRVGGRVLGVLQWKMSGHAAPAPKQVQPYPPFPGGRVDVVGPIKFAATGFSAAHLRGAVYRGYDTHDTLVDQVDACTAAGARIVLVYLPDPDRMAHEHGLADPRFVATLTSADAVIAALRARLPATGGLLVTADHGHVTIDDRARVDLRPLRGLVAAAAGSPRLRYLYARTGARHELHAAAVELSGEHGRVYGRDQFVAEGWLGPHVGPMTAGRVGDVVIAARGAAAFVVSGEGHSGTLRTMHGSTTRDEMLVPLLSVRGG